MPLLDMKIIFLVTLITSIMECTEIDYETFNSVTKCDRDWSRVNLRCDKKMLVTLEDCQNRKSIAHHKFNKNLRNHECDHSNSEECVEIEERLHVKLQEQLEKVQEYCDRKIEQVKEQRAELHEDLHYRCDPIYKRYGKCNRLRIHKIFKHIT